MGRFSLLIVIVFSSLLAWAGEGDLTFFVFRGHMPAGPTKIVIENYGDYQTDSSGVLDLTLPEGKYVAQIFNSEKEFQTVDLKVPPGESVYINITLLPKDQIVKDIRTTEPVFDSEQNLREKTHWISGRVLRQKENTPIAGAKVIVHGTQIELTTDPQGYFESPVPQGKVSLSVFHKSFSTAHVKDVSTVLDKKESLKTIILSPSGLELEEFVVLSPNLKSSVSALLEIRRSHVTVADLIGSEQISRSGDSDAGASLKRVTGLSLVDGKYVYVRGLGERYSSTLLNSSMMPSPDPSRRVVPLDLFPASVIENMVVQKGYSPEMPGEFGGGVIQIKTKSLPAKRYVNASLSIQLEDVGPVKTYEGGGKDWTGFDDGSRSLPSLLQRQLDLGKNISTLSPDERKELAVAINKSYNIRETTNDDVSNIPNFTLGFGDRLKVGRFRIGYNLSTLYSNKWSYDEERKTQYNQSGRALTEDSHADVANSKNKIKVGALVGLGLQYRQNKVNYNGSLLRNSESYVKQSVGVNAEKELYQQSELGWKERSIEAHQFNGESKIRSLKNATVEWHLSKSTARLEEPDNKMYVYKLQDGLYQLETENGSAGNTVLWNEMPDELTNYGFSYTQPFSVASVREAKFVAGYNKMSRKRDYVSRTFYFKFDDPSQNLDASQDPNSVFSNPAGELYQQANDTDNYLANQNIDAYFGNVIVSIKDWSFTSGVRFERSLQEVQSFKLFNSGTTVSQLETIDYLPAFSATYKVTPTMQVRANYSETLSRPDLREISNTVWNDVDQGAKFKGNPNLDSAQIQNMGVRWEWFFQRGEVLSLGFFQKNFINPIEAIYGSLSDDGRIVGTTDTQYTSLNIDAAVSRGLEFEFRKKLPYSFTFGGNYSLIE
ncbi:MAG: TonB-dependent receptor, partial [Bdellovibrionales bacterium]|nr:TonB-dependent receptor [Bdellovibrionales bacterium]